MKLLIFVALLTMTVMIAGCGSYAAKVDYDEEADFSDYQTFGWFPQKKNPGPHNPVANKLMETRIKRAVEKELTAKGYEMIVKERPDIRIAWHIGVKNKIDIDTYGYGHWRRRVVRTEVHRYKEGTLILDFIDPRQKQLVWRGWTTTVVNKTEKAGEKINDIVKNILAKYPPQK